MNCDLHTYLNVLESGSIDEKAFRSVLHMFLKFTFKTDNIVNNREDVALVYCRILNACQLIYEIDIPEKLPEDIKTQLLNSFNNIERLYLEIEHKDLHGSYVKTIWFLSELKTKAAEGRTGDIDRESLGEHVKDLLDIFNEIGFIFNIKDENGFIFPISKVVATVIKGRDFQEFRSGIEIQDIHTLQLAVKLFQTEDDEKILNTLKTNCNLMFINYLRDYCEIIDTIDFLNYQLNGTMIFHDSRNKKILIRSDRENYFLKSPEVGYQIQIEKDYNGQAIGWFVEYTLDLRDKLCDYSDFLRTEEGLVGFLKLLYDCGYKNVFLQKSIVKKSDNTIAPLNPYCRQDSYLIKGRLKKKAGKYFRDDNIRELLQEYRICPVRAYVMNRVTFGLCILLLNINNIGVDALGLDSLNNNSWYQEQVVNNWINNSKTNSEHLNELLGEWYQQLGYCEELKRLEKERIHPIDFLPLRQNLFSVYQKFCPSICKDEKIFFGRVKEETEGTFVIRLDLEENHIVVDYSKGELPFMIISKNQLIDDDVIDNWSTKVDTDIWFLYSKIENKGRIINQATLKTLHCLEIIQKNGLSFNVNTEITEIEYERLVDYVMLFEDTQIKVAKSTKLCKQEDVRSQIFLRVLHNMIWSKIDSIEKKNAYFDIIFAHQKADFLNIDKDSNFLRLNENVLYIPKDSATQGSVLSKIYENILKPAGRDPRYLYNNELSKNENDQYEVFGADIRHIVFLTDNFVNGRSTIYSIAAYMGLSADSDRDLGKKRLEKADTARLKYICEGKEVSISSILKANNIKVSVYAFYGTEEGRMKIEEFLAKHNIEFESCKYVKQLTNRADDETIDLAKKIWQSCKLSQGYYLYIRKYNLPKVTVFPDIMVEDSCLFINLFSKNKELYEG